MQKVYVLSVAGIQNDVNYLDVRGVYTSFDKALDEWKKIRDAWIEEQKETNCKFNTYNNIDGEYAVFDIDHATGWSKVEIEPEEIKE